MTSGITVPEHTKVHSAAEIFPMMTPDRFAELVEDIRENGLLEAITTDQEGALLDGRNRLLACEAAGVEPRYVTYKGDPWRFVISANLHRRHLTDTQRALIAGRLADRLPGRPSEKASYDAITEASPTRADAAKLLQVSPAAVHRARQLQRTGSPELNDLVEDGTVALYTGSRIAGMDPDDQETFVQRIARGISPSQAEPTAPLADVPTSDTPSPKRRTRPKEQHVIAADSLNAIAVDMNGIDLALKPITEVDPSITAEERATWVRAFTKGIQALTRVRKLMKETQQPQGE